jgi:hypothetical protein
MRGFTVADTSGLRPVQRARFTRSGLFLLVAETEI